VLFINPTVRKAFLLLLGTMLFLVPRLSFAREIAPQDVLEVRPYLSVEKVPAGSDFLIGVQVEVKDGWHITSNAPSYEFAVPTEVRFEPLEGISLGERIFPPATKALAVGGGGLTELFDGTFLVKVPAKAEPGLAPGDYILKGALFYQSCDDTRCLRPYEKPFEVLLPVVETGAALVVANESIFAGSAEPAGGDEDRARGTFLDTGNVSQMIKERGLLATLVLLFIGGLALNLTPCVYPIIPITISYFGGQSGKGGAVPRAVAYVLGISLMYSGLGVIAAFSGRMFGTALTHPAVLVLIAGMMFMLSLSMFGVYELRMPTALMNLGGTARTGIPGALLMGLTMGVVAAPCIGPFVIGLLTYVATLGDPFLGFLFFFMLSLGLGLPYLVLGIFSGSLSALPRSGEWMVGVRKIFGFILLIMALYFLESFFPEGLFPVIFSAALVFSGLSMVFFIDSGRENRLFHLLKSSVAVGLIVAGTWMGKPGGGDAFELNWQPYSEDRVEAARNSGMPVVVDFFADWCIPCKELDQITFRDVRLKKYAGSFVFLKADLTLDKQEEVKALQEKYGVQGVPTVIFLDGRGEEVSGARLTGFEDAEDFARRLEQVLAR